MEHEIKDPTSFGVQINNVMSKLRYKIIDKVSSKIMKDVQNEDEKAKVIRTISTKNCALIIVADKNNKEKVSEAIDKSFKEMKNTLDGGETTVDKVERIK